MKGRILMVMALLAGSALAFAAANGAWLKSVPQADRVRVNPYAGQPEAAAAGAVMYGNNCAKCHGAEGQGKPRRPALKSDRIRNATDGEIAWIVKNGEMFKGMPSWGGLPEKERWQIVTYLRSLNPPAATESGK